MGELVVNAMCISVTTIDKTKLHRILEGKRGNNVLQLAGEAVSFATPDMETTSIPS
jgi:hypothetical protein